MTIEQMYDKMKGTMTDTPNLNTKEGRKRARMEGISYDVTVREIRYMWSPELAERLKAQIPSEPNFE